MVRISSLAYNLVSFFNEIINSRQEQLFYLIGNFMDLILIRHFKYYKHRDKKDPGRFGNRTRI